MSIDGVVIEDADLTSYDDVVAMALARQPHRSRADVAWIFEESHNISHLVAKVARTADGEVVGQSFAVRARFLPPSWSIVSVLVAASHEGAGLGRALLAALDEDWGEGTTELRSMVADHEPRSLEVAEPWGYTVQNLGTNSQLELVDLPSPDLPPDVTLEDVPDFVFPDRDAVERMLLASQTHPEARTGPKMTLDQLAAPPAPGSSAITVIARVEGVPAGIIVANVQDGELQIHYTGIDPAFRGRGLAVLVKQYAHLRAAELGATVCRTTNEVTNAGIRGINAALGYVVTFGSYRLSKPLGGAGA